MNDNKIIICCSRCGSEMDANARYCMKCGNLNQYHDDNQKYSKILKKIDKGSNYVVGSGNKILNNEESTGVLLSSKNVNKKSFFLFNGIILGLAFIILVILPLITLGEFTLDSILKSSVFSGMTIFGLISIYLVCLQVIFIKADENWWASLIPFYNIYILSKIVFGRGYLFILTFIPIVNIIYMFVLLYKLGVGFKYNGVLTALFSFIMLPIISSSGNPFRGTFYVENMGNDAIEKTYKSNKLFIKIGFVFLIIGFIGSVFFNSFISNIFTQPEKTVIMLNNKTALFNVKRAIKGEYYSCMSGTAYVGINNGHTYYFYSEDFNSDLGIGSNIFSQGNGYVKVVYENDEMSYYTSYSDSMFGFPEISKDSLEIDSIQEDYKIEKPNGIICTID